MPETCTDEVHLQAMQTLREINVSVGSALTSVVLAMALLTEGIDLMRRPAGVAEKLAWIGKVQDLIGDDPL